MEKVEGYKTNKLFNIIKGILISLAVTIVLFLVFGTILSTTSLSESTINPVIIVITGISILIGASITCIKIENKGMITGGLVGGVYIGILYFTSSILLQDFSLNVYAIIMIISAIISGMVGGIIGVNIK